ncbi:MAG: hypothetical protein ACTSXO_10475 [Candidatus Heimdallarchaeota archaeon]
MTPKKKKTKSQSKTHRKRYGTLFNVGQVLIILGAVLIIVSAIIGIVQYLAAGALEGAWQSYTFGFVNVWLAAVVAIIVAVIIIWLAVDRRIYYRMNLYLYAIIIIIIALLAGNLGSLVVILGALIIIFYRLSKS